MKRMRGLISILIFQIAMGHAVHADEIPSGVTRGDTTGAGLQAPAGPGVSVAENSGAANYCVPVVAAPGRNGQTPQLSVCYSSAARGNGIFGLGWALSGLGSIERVGRRGAVPRYDDLNTTTDEFFLNLSGASRLVKMAGAPEDTIWEYRTEQESFTRIQFYKNQNFWVVKDKRGTNHVLGWNAETRLAGRWLLDRVIDMNGNYVVIEYVRNGEPLPRRVIYNGHVVDHNDFANATAARIAAAREVLFFYDVDLGEPYERPDPLVSYRTGTRIESRQRVRRIRVQVGNQQVRRYEFQYTPSDEAARSSLLTRIQEYGTDDRTAFPPITFEYSKNDRASKWEPAETRFAPGDEHHPYFSVSHGNPGAIQRDPPRSIELGFRFVDLNGDGCTDIIRGWSGRYDVPTARDSHVHLDAWISDCRGGWTYDPRWAPPVVFANFHDEQNFLVDTGMRFASLNGDSYPDLLQGFINGARSPEGNCGAGQTCLRAWINRGAAPCPGPDPMASGCKWVQDDRYRPPAAFTNFGIGGGDVRRNDDYGMQMTDLNGDGLTDIIQGWQNGPTLYRSAWISTGNPYDPRGMWVPTPSYAPPRAFVWWGPNHARLDLGVRLFDVNGDGLPDLVWGVFQQMRDGAEAPFSNGVYRGAVLNTGSGWSTPIEGGLYAPPDVFVKIRGDAPYLTESRGYLIGDVNGDGLTDLIFWRAGFGPGGERSAYLSTGRGWVENFDYAPPLFPPAIVDEAFIHRAVPFLINRGVRMETDLYGRGLTDILQNYACFMVSRCADSGLRAWRNNTGDQRPEVITSHPDVLISIKNPLGGMISMSYVPSTKKPTADCRVDWAAENPNPQIPLVMEVLACTANDPNPDRVPRLGDANVTRYEFSGGLYRGTDQRQEFLGFKTVRTQDVTTDDQTLATYLQEPCNKGATESTVTLNRANEIFSAARFEYQLPNDCQERRPPYVNPLVRQTSFMCDRSAVYSGDLVQDTTGCKQNVSEFAYDAYANPRLETHFGTGVPEDKKRITRRTFLTNEAEWLIGFPTEEMQYEGRSVEAGMLLSHRRFSYDIENRDNTPEDYAALPTKGNLTGAHVDCFDCPSSPSSLWRTVSHRHDPYGNVIWTKDPRGVQSEHIYDRLYQTFPVVDQKDILITEQFYDARFGAITESIDPNGVLTKSRYDVFGRKIQQWTEASEDCVADESEDLPPVKISYVISPAPGQSYVLSETRQSYRSGLYHWKKILSDGFGRTVQSQEEFEGGGAIVSTTRYNSKGLVAETTLPVIRPDVTAASGYVDLGAQPSTKITYDALGRTTLVLNPEHTDDNPSKNTSEYRLWEVVHKDENYHTTPRRSLEKASTYNAFGERIEVKEKNRVDGQPQTYLTRYHYDGLGRLIRTVDSRGEEARQTTFVYNALSQKTEMEDPDMGHWTYEYDLGGNILREVNARNEAVQFEYDNLNRITAKRYGGAQGDLVYTYDIGWHGMGRLFSIADDSGTREFKYDCKGRMRQVDQTTCDTTYTFAKRYDPQDRMIEKQFPKDDRNDPQGERIEYLYNARGLARAIRFVDRTGVPQNVITSIVYNEVGKPLTTSYANGLQTEHAYEPLTFRAGRIQTAGLQQLTYSYDKVGNVRSMAGWLGTGADRIDINRMAFEYDDLYRLRNARWPGPVGYGDLQYQYDRIGNIMAKEGRQYQYSDPNHAHAVTNVTGSNFRAEYAYDANGSLRRSEVNGETRTFVYDVEDRLVRINEGEAEEGNVKAVFIYDHTGRRVKKMAYGDTRTVTLYLGDGDYIIEQPSRKITKYIAGYAKRERDPDTTEMTMFYFHGDLLGSTSLITNESGEAVHAEIYKPYGETHVNTPTINERYRFTGQERDPETGLYYYMARYYDPILGRFMSADGTAPFQQEHPQTLNKYAYVLNNPLTLTDPTGEFAFIPILIGAVIGAVSSGVQSHWNPQAMLLGAAIGGASAGVGSGVESATSNWVAHLGVPGGIGPPTAGSTFAGTIVGGAAGGAAAGASSAALYRATGHHANILKSMWTGAAIGGGLGLLDATAMYMRHKAKEQSSLYVDQNGNRPNIARNSPGLRGDKVNLSGCRWPCQKSLAGGAQWKQQGKILGIPYDEYGFVGWFVQNWAGPHDFLSWPLYDAVGNSKYTHGWSEVFASAYSSLALLPSIPFAVKSMFEYNSSLMPAFNSMGYETQAIPSRPYSSHGGLALWPPYLLRGP